MAEESKTQVPRSPDFISRYANNVQFEVASLDIRILFGQSSNSRPLAQHSEIILTPAEAKLMCHFLRVNVAIFESAFGKIAISKDLIPAPPTAPTDTQTDASFVELYHKVKKLHDEFLGGL